MKRIITVFALSLSVLGMAACSTNETQTEAKQTVDQTKQKKEEQAAKYTFPEGAAPAGNAKVVAVTKNGTSDNGAVPVVNLTKDMTKEVINLNLVNFNKDNLVIVYLDKEFRGIKSGGEMVESPLTLRPENALKAGVHTVTAVQFEKNNPKGKIINYTEAKFEVKEVK